MLASLLSRRFIAVIGKGGTGKTTVSALLGLMAAAQGKRVLIAMANAKERLSALLETEGIDHEVKTILGSIDAVNMDPDHAIEEYGIMILKIRALYKAVIDNKMVKGFLRATPGMDAWSMLGKALYHVKQTENDRPVYDLVILDAPATGHGLQMLRVPQVIAEVAPPGLLRREAEEGLVILRDSATTAVVVCSLAEEMPVSETEELVTKLRNELKLNPAAVVANQILQPLFDAFPTEARRAAEVFDSMTPLAPMGPAVRARVAREQLQHTMLKRLYALGLPVTQLPAIAVEKLGRTHVQSLARACMNPT